MQTVSINYTQTKSIRSIVFHSFESSNWNLQKLKLAYQVSLLIDEVNKLENNNC